jgi:chemotaxis protein CheZ
MSDSPELEALFDSIAYPAPAPAAPTPAAPTPAASTSDSPELEALFDSIAAAVVPEPAAEAEAPALDDLYDGIAQAIAREEAASDTDVCPERVFAQVGQMTRNLHDMLRELGYDKALNDVAKELPDNRDRLNYIAAMTAQAAERTLNAAEAAQPIQASLGQTARQLAGDWDKLFAKQLGVAEFKALVSNTRAYLGHASEASEATNAQLMEIIMAQDFQDLTGQVIKKIIAAAQTLEQQLITLLIETTPEDKRDAVVGKLEGPVVNASGRNDVVTSQEQVDDLLASLGF